MGKIYYDPYEVYGCCYCREATPNDNKICDKCYDRYVYCTFDGFIKWFMDLFN